TSGQEPITDSNGEFIAKVPAGTTYVHVEFIATENEDRYWTKAPTPVQVPQDVTTDIGTFSLASPCPAYLEGYFRSCDGEPLDGIVVAAWSGGISYMYAINGSFKLTAPSGSVITLTGTVASGEIAQPKTIVAGQQGSDILA